MTRPTLRYTTDQQKVIALLEEKPLSRDELLAHFPHKTKYQLSTLLRNPREMGKIVVNREGKYELYTLPQNAKVIKGSPQPYTAPPKLEPIVWESDQCQ